MRRFFQPKFSILFCLISMLFLSALLATTVSSLQAIHKDASRLKEVFPTFPDQIDWDLPSWDGEPSTINRGYIWIDEGLTVYRLDQVSSLLAWLSNLTGSKINYRITNLSIESTDFGNEELKIISKITSLKRLALRFTVSVDDKSLEILREMDQLEELLIENKNVTQEEIALLQNALPDCDVHIFTHASNFQPNPFLN